MALRLWYKRRRSQIKKPKMPSPKGSRSAVRWTWRPRSHNSLASQVGNTLSASPSSRQRAHQLEEVKIPHVSCARLFLIQWHLQCVVDSSEVKECITMGRREGQIRGLNGILSYSFWPQVGLPLRNSFGSGCVEPKLAPCRSAL